MFLLYCGSIAEIVTPREYAMGHQPFLVSKAHTQQLQNLLLYKADRKFKWCAVKRNEGM